MPYRAALPMYRIGRATPAADELWSALVRRLRARGVQDLPHRLDLTAELDALWRDPALLLAQTCGYPLMTSLAGRVRLVATPVYDAPGCDGAYSRSALVVRADDARPGLEAYADASAAVNASDSNSGMNLFREAVAPLATAGRFFRAILATGSHLASLAAVASGAADIAAIDPVSLALATDAAIVDRAALRVIRWTGPTPNLPLITSVETTEPTVAALQDALQDIAADPALAATRGALRLAGFVALDLSAYERVREAERAAIDAGFPSLDPSPVT